MSELDDRGAVALEGQDVALSVLHALGDVSTLVFDRELRFILAAGESLTRHGLQESTTVGQQAERVLGPDRWEVYEPLYLGALRGEARSIEVWSADETSCYEVQVSPLRGPDGEIFGGSVIYSEITQRKHSEEARRHTQERFELIFEQAPIGMALVTTDGRPVRVNRALQEITGYGAQELLSKTLAELTHPDENSAEEEHARRLLAGESTEYQIEKRYLHARGHVIWARLSVSLVCDRQGKPLHFIAQIEDITERKLSEERLRRLAECDALTGTRNRRVFEHELTLQVGRSRRHGERAVLLVLDLDNFKQINHTHGHRTGDGLLSAIAVDLQRRLRGTDLIARLGGDEFAVLLRHTDRAAAEAVAEDLAEVVAGCSFEVLGKQVSCSASIGVASIDQEVSDERAVLIEAERAMYTAKGTRAKVLQFPPAARSGMEPI